MIGESSPFTPGVPVPVEFFVGRAGEIEKVRSAWREASHLKVPKTVFVSGERGIGKSSLASFVRVLADREHAQLSAHVYLGGIRDVPEMARKVWEQIVKDSIDKPWHRRLLDAFGSRIRQVGLFGVTLELQMGRDEMDGLARSFVPSLRELLKHVGTEPKAPLLILDDINGLADSADFANWLKSTIDEAATAAQRLPLALVLVGLEERRQSLIRLQASLGRVFDVVDVQPWSMDETRSFFERTFASAGRVVEGGAMVLMVRFSGGFPVLAHEVGDAVFRADEDGRIDVKDALTGVRVAAEVLGRKLLQPQVYRALHSRRYLNTLRKAALLGFSFTVSQLRPRLDAEEARALPNFLTRMKQLGVIVPDHERGRGSYRFSNLLHHAYFRMEASRAQRMGTPGASAATQPDSTNDG